MGFRKSVESDRLNAMWLMYATTGMRRGEVLGLRWRDVDHKHVRKLLAGEMWTNSGLVFTTELGGPIDPQR